MAAPKLENLFKKDQGAQDKVHLEILIKKLNEMLKDPTQAKKAAQIIENLIHQKK